MWFTDRADAGWRRGCGICGTQTLSCSGCPEAVGEWYVHFDQTSDDEVLTLLTRAREQRPAPNAEAAPADPLQRDDDVEIHVGNIVLPGHVTIPERPPRYEPPPIPVRRWPQWCRGAGALTSPRHGCGRCSRRRY